MSESLVKNDIFTSIHIEEHTIECRKTKLGDEEITRASLMSVNRVLEIWTLEVSSELEQKLKKAISWLERLHQKANQKVLLKKNF